MIISENKPFEEILGYIKNAKKIVLVGCNQCAATCKSGGEEEVLKMKERLESEGKEILGYQMLDPACNLLKSKKDLVSINDADSLIVYSKGDVFVSQNWINSDLNHSTSIIEIESNSHNPLLTNIETYEKISKFMKNSLK